MHIIPGDAATVIAGDYATKSQIEHVRNLLGLVQPLHVQLGAWLWRILHGDFGQSFMLGRGVLQAIGERLPTTILLSTYSMLLTMPLGIAAGLVAAYWRKTWIDTAVMSTALVGVSLPGFWLSVLAVMLFAVKLGWFPTSGYVAPSEDLFRSLRSLTLPAVCLSVIQIGLLARMTRATALEVLGQDYIRTARAKGLSEWATVSKHCFANTMIPVVTVIGLLVNVSFAGAVVIEQIFVLPGVGQLVVQAILRRDYPVIQGSILVVSVLLVAVNLLVDISYAYLDPRLRDAR